MPQETLTPLKAPKRVAEYEKRFNAQVPMHVLGGIYSGERIDKMIGEALDSGKPVPTWAPMFKRDKFVMASPKELKPGEYERMSKAEREAYRESLSVE